MTEQESNIRFFFNYFRKQIEAIDHLGERQLLPAQHVIAGAALDALAEHWAQAFMPGMFNKKSADRMQAFLEEFDDPNVFARVSQPLLMRRAREPKEKFTNDQINALLRLAPDLQRGRIRRWQEDPLLNDLAASLASAGITTEKLSKSTYGRLIYKLYRCGWLHQFGADRDLGHESSITSPNFIGYENYDNRARLVIPIVFMRDTLSRVIDQFEAQCLQHNIVPAREEDDDGTGP